MYKHKQEILFGMLKTILTIQLKEEEILSAYIESETFVIPDSIYEGVLDDDFVDVEDKYAQSLTYDDVPDSFVEKYAENEADDALLELSEDERAARCCEEI